MHHGPLVKWLRQRPLTPLTSVRIRYGSPAPYKKCVDKRIKLCYNAYAIRSGNTFDITMVKSHPQEFVLITMRVHLFPSRTQKLSSFVPTIVAGRLAVKIGNANTQTSVSFDGGFSYRWEQVPPVSVCGAQMRTFILIMFHSMHPTYSIFLRLLNKYTS